MPKTDSRVDNYISEAADFAKPILTRLRKLVHSACPDAEETLKWRCPHFLHHGMLCSMAAFKNHCAFGFWRGDLIFADEKRAAKQSEAMGHFGRIATLSDLPADEEIIRYIRKAARLNETGLNRSKRRKTAGKKALIIPDYFVAALKRNERALETFENFSYSHKKEYVEWVTEAKREETRQKRLQTTLAWLAKAKPRHWKYVKG